MRSILTVLTLLAGLILIPAGTACACTCVPFEVDRGVADTAEIFTGTVTDVRKGSMTEQVVATIQADQIYKGEGRATYRVETGPNSAACGYDFTVGSRYLVFASKGETADAFRTSLCAGNRPAAKGTAPLTRADLAADDQQADALLAKLGTPTPAPVTGTPGTGAGESPIGSSGTDVILPTPTPGSTDPDAPQSPEPSPVSGTSAAGSSVLLPALGAVALVVALAVLLVVRRRRTPPGS